MTPNFSILESTDAIANWLEILKQENLEKQCKSIAKLLKQQTDVEGIAFLLHDQRLDQTFLYSEDFSEDILHSLQESLPKFNQAQQSSTQVRFLSLRAGKLCALNRQTNDNPSDQILVAIPLAINDSSLGILALQSVSDPSRYLMRQQSRSSWLGPLVTYLLEYSISHEQKNNRISRLNLYQTVSSSLCYIDDLQELLTTIMSLVTTELHCEEGSVLIYDDCEHEFEFFTVVGESEEELRKIRFPADQGIAGLAIKENKTLRVNDVKNCPDFYPVIDKLHDFQTRSILAAPLRLKGEPIGVIEAINKRGNTHFIKEDEQILSAIADEVTLAIRNARLFEAFVDLYCKRRQGEINCRGCERPLKSWMPCALHMDL